MKRLLIWNIKTHKLSIMKRLITALLLILGSTAYGQCPDPDTVTNNTVTLITATTARVNGTQATPTTNQTIVLRYVRSGFTDTVSATGSGVMRNLTGLSPSTLYKYYYRTLCSDGRTDNQASYYTFTTLTSTVLYVPERPTVFQSVKTDSFGIAFVAGDTVDVRTPTDLAKIKYKSSDNTFYGYYLDCACWRPLATDSAGIIAQLDLKVDSVTVSGDSLFWWNNHGVSHGYILPALNNVWKLTGNGSTDTTDNFVGTTDALPLKFKINGVQSGFLGFGSTSFGYQSFPTNASSGVSAFGNAALKVNTGNYNTAVGNETMFTNSSGEDNTAIGAGSLYSNTTGARNAALGFYSLRNVTTGTNNIGIGYFAGNYSSTASNQFFLNSLDRTNLAGDTTKSLVYGIFNATAASQRFKINGRLEINDGTQSAGYIAVSDANGRSTWTAPSGIVTATPTLQQVRDAGSTTTGDISFNTSAKIVFNPSAAGELMKINVPVGVAPAWQMKIASVVNGGGTYNSPVVQGFNQYGNIDAAKAGIYVSMEDNYRPSPSVQLMEYHAPEVYVPGNAAHTIGRLFSNTFIVGDSLFNSSSQWDMRANVFYLKNLKDTDYVSFTSDLTSFDFSAKFRSPRRVSGVDINGTNSAAITYFDASPINQQLTFRSWTAMDLGTSYLILNGATSGSINLKVPSVITTYDLTLPTTDGNSGEFLQTNGSGVTTWAVPSSGLTVGTTTITSGTNTRVLYNNSGVVGEYLVTGTGSVSMSASPTFTGTINAAALTMTGTLQMASSSQINNGGTTAYLGFNGNNIGLYTQNGTYGNVTNVIGDFYPVSNGTQSLGVSTQEWKLLCLKAAVTTASCSTSGTVAYSQPFQGATYKKVMAYCNAALGTASYTFPQAFTNTPIVVTTNGLATTVVTALSTTAVTITGATSTGFIIIEGY